MTTPCCPYCRSEDLKLIGALLIHPTGAPYESDMRMSDMEPEDVHVTREFLRCVACKKEFKATEAHKAAGEDVQDVAWEVTQHGVKIPIVCPECGNQEHFVRTVLELVRKDEDVVVEDGVPELQFVGGDIVVDHRAHLHYRCGNEDCDGVVELFTNDFHIVHST